MEAGIVLEKGARAVVRGSYIHDSVGAGIVVRAGAAPQVWHNVVTANGKAAGRPVAGIELEAGADPVFFGNIVRGNGDDQIAGLPPERRAEVARDNIVGPPVVPPTPAPRQPGKRP
jgi:Right handed beta helix region